MLHPISLIFNRLAVSKSKVVFSNFDGRGYGCNPKYITEELLKRDNNGLDLVWLTNSNESEFPSGVRVVRWGSLRALYEWATARVIVNNVRMGRYFSRGFNKKLEQVYFQTWHGSMGIKKAEADCSHLTERYLKRSRLDSSKIDYLISNCTWLTGIYKKSFFYDGAILECGSPRNDIFFDANIESKIDELKKRFGFSRESKVVLYAPTFRDCQNGWTAKLDIRNLKKTLSEKFGGAWELVVRSHPNQPVLVDDEDGFVDLSAYPDPQEILLMADCLITDYSSLVYDYMLMYKPAFIYAPDYEEYKKERGFYYSIYDTPFPVSGDYNELLNDIRNFSDGEYKLNVREFLENKGAYDRGCASKEIADMICEIVL